MRLPPCKKNGKDCPLRKPACSSSCKEYKEWHRENVQKPNEARARENIALGYTVDDIEKRKAQHRKCKNKVKINRAP